MYWKERKQTWSDEAPLEGCCHSVVKHQDAQCDDYLYVFGGGVVGVYRNILYKYSFKLDTWHRVRTEGEIPGLMSHAAVVHNGEMYCYGGLTSEGCVNDVWKISLEGHHNTWKRLKTTGTPPSPTKAHSAVLIKNEMWVFYGAMDNAENSDTVSTLNLETLSWTRTQFPVGATPAPRNGHTTIASTDRYVYLYGGLSVKCGSWVQASRIEVWLSDIWRLDTVTLKWALLCPDAPQHGPKGRYSHFSWLCNNDFFVFGGDTANCTTYFSDLWVFSLSSLRWEQRHFPGDHPPPLSGISGVPHEGAAVFYGGEKPDSSYSASLYTIHTASLPTPLSLIMQRVLIQSCLHLTNNEFRVMCKAHGVPVQLVEAMLQCKPRHRCKRVDHDVDAEGDISQDSRTKCRRLIS